MEAPRSGSTAQKDQVKATDCTVIPERELPVPVPASDERAGTGDSYQLITTPGVMETTQ
jgi:hypothetical protein